MNKHLPQLDGLRGIAILIVVLGHLIVFNFGLGVGALGPVPPLGVDLFFVLSGFLITRILLDSRHQPNYFKSFYVRRALRIWPLYFAVLGILFVATNHRIPALTFDESRVHWPVFAFYFQNVFYRQASQLGPLALAITWSLAVEEQFYAIWPIVVRKLSIRALTAVLFVTIAVAPIARFVAPRFGIDPYINPVCRFDAMAMGGLLAIWLLTHKASKGATIGTMWLVLSLAALAEVVCHFVGLTQYLSKTIASAAFTGLLASSLHSDLVSRTLCNRLLCSLGKVSYCIYLAHPIVAAIVLTFWPGPGLGIRLLRVASIALGTSLVAALSWRFFEEPILRLKRYFPPADPQYEVRLRLAPADGFSSID
jgi:peptidoglycan/LPS O-acetylase OafA/YrhL